MATLFVLAPDEKYNMDSFREVFPKEAVFEAADGKIGAKIVRKNSEISAVITGWTRVHGLDKLAEAVREKTFPGLLLPEE